MHRWELRPIVEGLLSLAIPHRLSQRGLAPMFPKGLEALSPFEAVH